MIRQLLTLSIAAATAMSASAVFTPVQFGKSRQQTILDKELKLPASLVLKRDMSQIMKKNSTRATEKIEWGYCEEPYVCLPVDGDVKIAAMMAAETSTTFAGNKISGILVANPVDAKLTDWNTGVYVNSVKEATIWLSNSLDGEPFLTSTGELGPDGFEWSFINFDQP